MPTELPALPRRLDLTSQLGKRPSAGSGRRAGLQREGRPAARGRLTPTTIALGDSLTIMVAARMKVLFGVQGQPCH